VELLKKQFPDKNIFLIDERFTSSMALDTMIRGGMSKKNRKIKANVDRISATIMLQSYLEMKR
jgi:putative Holliday junction resolvase